MKRVFLDANVLFTAAHNASGKAVLVIELGAGKHWRLCTSVYAVEEARRNISVKFPDALQRLDTLLGSVAVVQHGTGAECPIKLREKDRTIFLSAMKCKATHLLTGDIRDFGPFMNQPEKTQGIIIQTVAEFLAAL